MATKIRTTTAIDPAHQKLLMEETFESRIRDATPSVTTPVTVLKREIRTTTTRSSRPSSVHFANGIESNGPASAVLHRREEERKEMEQLNDKFADYIQKVRFLQAQNRKLGDDIAHLNTRPTEQNIKTLWETELNAARDVSGNMAKTLPDQRARLEALHKEAQKLQDKTEQLHRDDDSRKAEIDAILLKLRDAEKEISFLRGKIALEETDEAYYRKQNNWLTNELQKVKTQYNHTLLERIAAKNELDALLEEEIFLKKGFENELKELRTIVENRLFFDDSGLNEFRSDLSVAIQGIKNELLDRLVQNKSNMESWYKLKVQEIQSSLPRHFTGGAVCTEETRVLSTQLQENKDAFNEAIQKNQQLEKDYRDLLDKLPQMQREFERKIAEKELEVKQLRQEGVDGSAMLRELGDLNRMLREEIRIYRILVAGAEMTVSTGEQRATALTMEDVTKRMLKSQEELEKLVSEKGEQAVRIKTTQSTRGNLKIIDADVRGKFVTIENIGNEAQPLDDIILIKSLDGVKENRFNFPPNISVAPGQHVKVFAKGAGQNKPPGELVANEVPHWGIGHYCKTILKSKSGEELGNYTQNISYATATPQHILAFTNGIAEATKTTTKTVVEKTSG